MSSIAPIMKRNKLSGRANYFEKGEVGTSMFVIHDGQVGIYDGKVQLATLEAGRCLWRIGSDGCRGALSYGRCID
ncbi:MAG: hypothetical protein R2822_25320 [Spirosomataceae bacterium]